MRPKGSAEALEMRRMIAVTKEMAIHSGLEDLGN